MAQQGLTFDGYKYILSVKDYFTKIAYFRPLKDKEGMQRKVHSFCHARCVQLTRC
jgi:hypothetical protein